MPAARPASGGPHRQVGLDPCTMRMAGIEIRQADAGFEADGKSYPAGAYVIGPQAFRPQM